MDNTAPVTKRHQLIWGIAFLLFAGYLFVQGANEPVHWAFLIALLLTIGMMIVAVSIGKFASSPLGRKAGEFINTRTIIVVAFGYMILSGCWRLWQYFDGSGNTADAFWGGYSIIATLLFVAFIGGIKLGRSYERRGV